MTIPERLKSRKLWMAILAVLGHVLLAVSGQVTWQDAGNSVTMIVAAYLAVQGYVDGKKQD